MSQKLEITIDEILAIPLEDILRYVQIPYIKRGDVIKLCEWSRVTWWWLGSKSKWIVSDFSNKGRPSWNVFWFIKELNEYDDKQTFDFFKTYKYWISDFSRVLVESTYRKIENDEDAKKREQSVKDMIDVYHKLDSNSEEAKKYLAWRNISFDTLPETIKNEVKSATINFEWIRYKDKLFIPMKDLYEEEGVLKSKIVWIKARSTSAETNPKFKSISIKNSYIWMFMSDDMLKIKEGKLMFLCEGETDALALYSAGFKNVVWNLWWVWYVNRNFNKLFNRFKQVLIVYDNDEPGQNWIKKVIENVGFDLNYWTLDFAKVRKIIWEMRPELEAEGKLSWKLDINDILKFVNWDTERFKYVIQNSSKLFNKDKLLKEIKKRDAEVNAAFKKTSPIKK